MYLRIVFPRYLHRHPGLRGLFHLGGWALRTGSYHRWLDSRRIIRAVAAAAAAAVADPGRSAAVALERCFRLRSFGRGPAAAAPGVHCSFPLSMTDEALRAAPFESGSALLLQPRAVLSGSRGRCLRKARLLCAEREFEHLSMLEE